MSEKLAIVLFNLGGPDSPEAVEPFLRNLFGDRAIIALPAVLRLPLARLIAARRAPLARSIYRKIGGASPIVAQTQAQAVAMDDVLIQRGLKARTFIAMRYWRPFAAEAVEAIKAWRADRLVLLPLYPQFSSTTTASSLMDWKMAARVLGVPATAICCFPEMLGFVAAQARLIRQAFAAAKPGVAYRLLLSAHGLPERTIARGDPYQWQVERTARAIVDSLGMDELDWAVCYQSRVGPLKWIGPATEAEIRRAGGNGRGVIIAPIAFVSEHSETLVELDIEYAHLAKSVGVSDYIRVPAVGTEPAFIEGLADLVMRAAAGGATVNDTQARICPAGFQCCIYEGT